MWCPFNQAYTIKEYIVCCDVHLTALTQLKSAFFDVMNIWPILDNWKRYGLMWCPSDVAYAIKKVIVLCDVHLP